jgi:hypothetical protein
MRPGYAARSAFTTRASPPEDRPNVPTLFRFFAILAIVAGLGFAGMFALATFVKPTPREITVSIPASKLQPPR